MQRNSAVDGKSVIRFPLLWYLLLQYPKITLASRLTIAYNITITTIRRIIMIMMHELYMEEQR